MKCVRQPKNLRRCSQLWAFTAVVLISACGSGRLHRLQPDAAAADAAAVSNLPAKCTLAGIDYAGNIQVRVYGQLKGDKQQSGIEQKPGASGQAIDVPIQVSNAANPATAAAIAIDGIEITYYVPVGASDDKSPFECLVGDGAAPIACVDVVAGATAAASIVPLGFDADCVAGKSAELFSFVVRFHPPSDHTAHALTVKIKYRDMPDGAQKAFTIVLTSPQGEGHLTLSPPELDCGILALGADVTRVLSLGNAGPADVTVSKLEVATNDSKAFSLQIADQTYAGGFSGQPAQAITLKSNWAIQGVVHCHGVDALPHQSAIRITGHDGKDAKIVKIRMNN